MNKEVILTYLEKISNGCLPVNFVMHMAVIALVTVMIVKKGKLHKAYMIIPIGILVLSVLAHAIVYGNPFHMITFALFAVSFLVFYKKNQTWMQLEASVLNGLAGIVILSGFWYPEFVHTGKIGSLLLSPVGVVPCATLLVTVGFFTLYSDYLSRGLCVAGVAMAAIYGIVGVFVLDVEYDVFLLAAEILLLVKIIISAPKK